MEAHFSEGRTEDGADLTPTCEEAAEPLKPRDAGHVAEPSSVRSSSAAANEDGEMRTFPRVNRLKLRL